MKNKMMTFESFNLIKELNESHDKFNKELEYELALNEAFKSNYLRDFSSQENKSRGFMKQSFAKDFNKYASIELDKITNEDFTILSNATDWWTQGWAKNDQCIGFFVDDNPTFLNMLERKGKLKKGLGIGALLTVMRGNRGMWYGFATDPGKSYSRYRKGSTERYGALADQYDTDTLYGYNGVKAKISRKNLEEIASKVYVLDMTALKEKYSSADKVSTRTSQKRGATALMAAKDIKAANVQNYKDILQSRLDPKIMFTEVKETLAKYNDWISKKVDSLSLDNIKFDKEDQRYFREEQVNWGNWNSSLMRPIEDMWKLLNKFMESYYEFLSNQAHVEELTEKLEKASDSEAQRIQGEINYYEKSYNRFKQTATSYREQILKYKKDVDVIISK